MSRHFASRRSTRAALLLAAAAMSVSRDARADRYWKNSVTAGNWSLGSNWSASSASGTDNAGPPTSSDNAYLAGTTGGSFNITLDTSSSIGDLTVDNSAGGVDTLTLASPNSLATGNQYIGYNGSGAFIQSAGTNTPSQHLEIGYAAGSAGSYTLSGGALVANGFNKYEYVGDFGAGTFTQTGGTNNASFYVILGNNIGSAGTYTLTGTGSLGARTEYIGLGGAGTFIQSGGTNSGQILLGSQEPSSASYTLSGSGVIASQWESIGDDGTATFTQAGGTNTVQQLGIGEGGSSTGTYILSAGTLTVSALDSVGSTGTGEFQQSGGVHLSSGSLVVGLGVLSTAVGTYNLSGGTLTVSGSEYVGYEASGTFIQSGGTHTVAQSLELGYTTGGVGAYTLNGGTLAVNNITDFGEVIGDAGVGTFTQTGGTNSQPSGIMYLGKSPGASGYYNLSGGTLAAQAEGYNAGTATFIQSGGGNTTVNLFLGYTTNSTASYTLSGGTLEAIDFEAVGMLGAASFTQTGGVNFLYGAELTLGGGTGSSGTYTLSGTSVLTMVDADEEVGSNRWSNSSAGGAGTFIQTGGSNLLDASSRLLIGSGSLCSGTYNLSGGTLSAGAETLGSTLATGTFLQSGGSNTVQGDLSIATLPTSIGYYALNGTGSTSVAGNVEVGGFPTATAFGSGALIVSSGTLTVAGTLDVYPGSNANLYGGALTVGSLNLNGNPNLLNWFNGTLSINKMDLPIGTGGVMGTRLDLLGGKTLNVAQTVSLTSGGQINLYGGALSAGTLNLGNYANHFNWNSGTLSVTASDVVIDGSGNFGSSLTLVDGQALNIVQSEYIGNSSSGTFTQNGGSHNVGQALILASTPINSTGAMALSGGTLQAGSEWLGGTFSTFPGAGAVQNPGGAATFVQTGGTNTIASSAPGGQSFYVFNSASYALAGGTLSLPALPGSAINNGAFTLSGNGTLKGYLTNTAIMDYLGNSLMLGLVISGGTLDSAGTIENQNQMGIAGGQLNGTLINDTSGTITHSGGIVAGCVSNNGQYTLSGGTFNATGAFGLAQNLPGGIFEQSGGTIGSATFTNAGLFEYLAGTNSGFLWNQSTASIIGNTLRIGGGAENDAWMSIGAQGTATAITFGGNGLDNFGMCFLQNAAVTGNITNESSGTLTGGTSAATINGNLVNAGGFLPYALTVNGSLTNSGSVSISLADATALKVSGGISNSGMLQFAGGQLTGGSISNNAGGTMSFGTGYGASQSYSFPQQITNNGGVITLSPGTNVTFSNFGGNLSGGYVQIADNAALTASSSLSSSGEIDLLGASSALNGGTFTNTGSVIGQGRITNTLLNSGYVEAAGGKLTLSGAHNTNASSAQLIIDSAQTMQFTQGLSTNSGVITNNNGTFDNNSQPLTNASGAIINGNGTFKTGGTGLTNTAGAQIIVSAGTSFYGPVIDNGWINIYGSTTTFYGKVTENAGGTITVNNGAVYFLGNASINGLYASDPSTSYIFGLSTGTNGVVTGGTSDSFFITGGASLNNAGQFNNAGTLSVTNVINSGTFTQSGTFIAAGNFTNSGTTSLAGKLSWSNGTTFTNTAGAGTFLSDAGSATSAPLTVNASGGTVNFASTQHLAAVSIGAGGTAVVDGPANTVLVTRSLSDAGTLNLTNRALVLLDTTALGAIKSLITRAADISNGKAQWDMPGITSSTAAGNPTDHAIGYALASSVGSTGFDGITFSDAILARYTLLGDASLKGTVDLSDYTKVVLNLGKNNASWSDGNFDYSGNVNLGDYTAVIRNLGRTDGQFTVFNGTGPSAAQVKASALTLHTAPTVTEATTATDVTLLVNPTNGRVTLVNALQTGQAVITAYTINSPSQSLLPFSADGGGKYLANALENNPSVFYKASNGLTYNLWTGIKNVSTFIGEGFSNHYNANVDSTWTNYTLATSGYALGTLFKRLSSGGTKDLVFQWEDANLNTYTSVVNYVNVPEPGSVSLITMAAMTMLRRRRRK